MEKHTTILLIRNANENILHKPTGPQIKTAYYITFDEDAEQWETFCWYGALADSMKTVLQSGDAHIL